jgi:dolichol-phosphate mannosyltransferase
MTENAAVPIPESATLPSRNLGSARTAAPRLALVIPTLHEGANIASVINRIRGSLDPLGISYQVIVVDDDSRDGTDTIVQKLTEADPRVRLLVRTGKRGLGGAAVHGWQHSDAEILGLIDADLQHPPELLPQLWSAIETGSDLVLASRYAPRGNMRQWNPVRQMLSRFAIWMTRPLQKAGIHVADPMSGFFLVRRSCVEDVTLQTQGFKILLEILTRGKIRSVTEVPFEFGLRQAGTSKAGIKEGVGYLWLLGRLWRQRNSPGIAPAAEPLQIAEVSPADPELPRPTQKC